MVRRELAEAQADETSETEQLEWLLARAVPGTPYARPVGTPQSLAAITLADVRQFVTRYYVPERVILVVTGPTAGEQVSRTAIQLGGAIVAGPDPADRSTWVEPEPAEAPTPALDGPVAQGIETRSAAVERPTLWVAWAVPGELQGGGPRAIAAAQYLEYRLSAVAARLQERVVSGDATTLRHQGVSLVVGQLTLRDAGDAQRALDAFRSEKRFRHGTSFLEKEDLIAKEAVRDALVLEHQLAMESLDTGGLAATLRTTGMTDALAGLERLIKQQLSADTHDYVARYLDDKRLVALLVVPGGAPRLTGALMGRGEQRGGDTLDGEPDAGTRLDFSRLRPAVPVIERRRLSNGLEVVVAPRPGFPVAGARLVIRAPGVSARDLDLETVALWSSACSGQRFRPADGHLLSTTHGPASWLPASLSHMACGARAPEFNAPAFERLRRAIADELERRPVQGDDRLTRIFLSSLFPGAGYEQPSNPDVIRDFGTGEAKAFLRQTLRPDRAVLIISGAVKPDAELWKGLEKLFGSWKPADAEAKALPGPAPLPEQRRLVIIDQPGATQASLFLGVRVTPRAARDEPAWLVLSDHLTTALEQRLRVEQGLTYGVHASSTDLSRGSALVVRTTVPSAGAAGAIQAILSGLEATRAPLDAAALERARQRVAREQLLRFGTSQRNGRRLEELFLYRLPTDEWDTFMPRLAAVQPAGLQAVAQGLGVGREQIVVVGDARQLRPALEAAGLLLPEGAGQP
ncbi:MAG: insulinase family protein [Anaeromyxobacter sp.]